jgi:acetyl-CoA acetyltransferase
MSLARSCAIAGIGNTAYTRGTDRSTLELHLEASLAALADAGLTPADVDGVLPSANAGRSAEDFIVNLGLRDLSFAPTAHMGGASLLSSVRNACLAIEAGVASCVLVPAGRRGYSGERVSTGAHVVENLMATIAEFEWPYGNISAAQWFAQAAQRHMYVYGTTSEQLGHVAVTCRAHANLNPQALMHGRPMTLADHQASRMITTPFRLLDCSLESDGAGALVITSADRARSLGRGDAVVAGIGEAHDRAPTSISQKRDPALLEAVAVAAERAFAMSGTTVADADAVLVHEGFSWMVIGCLEAIGAVKPGEGGPFVADGNIALGGRLPVNPHGGALSEGHVSGVNHVIEAVRQLRRSVEPARQVPDCSTVVVVNEGNFFDGAALVLEKGER